MTTLRVVVATVACMVALAACGDDSRSPSRSVSSASPSTTTTTETTPAPDATESTTTSNAPAAPGAPPTTARRSTATTAPPSPSPSATASPSPSPSPTTTAAPATTTTTTTTAGSGGAITIQNFTFQPPVLGVSAGTSVTATNRDGANHTWTADDGSWDSGPLGKDASFARTFPTAGTFNYHCEIHPSMKGTVQVG